MRGKPRAVQMAAPSAARMAALKAESLADRTVAVSGLVKAAHWAAGKVVC